MRTGIVGGVLLLVGAVTIATGVLPAEEAITLWDRTWPVLLFVVAITIVTELAAAAGLFGVVAERMAKWGLGRAWMLWLLVAGLSVVSTILLSLDTTAVLLTPVVVLLARHNGLPPLPFALTTGWLANTASLLLPVSNLTNLLAQHELGMDSPLEFASLMALPALVGIVIPCVVIFVVFRTDLLRRFTPHVVEPRTDRVLLVSSAVVVVAMLPLLVSGIDVWIPSSIGALVLGAVFAVRKRQELRWSLVPWQLMLLASGLLLVVEAAHARGLATALGTIAGTTGDDAGSLLRLAAGAAVGSNLVNNLPAYLALEPIAGSTARTAALLIGTNLGPLITPWASLATLLWHARLHSMGVEFSWRRYMVLGIIVAPLTVVGATLTLAL